jgi:hypothetical protein
VNEDRREIGWKKEIWQRRHRMEKETKMLLFLELLPLCLGKTVSRKLVGKINHSLVIKFLFFGQRLLR